MFRAIHLLSTKRKIWFILFLVIVSMLGFAYFLQIQYNLLPCYYCINTRYYLSLAAIVCLCGCVVPNSRLFRTLIVLGFFASVIFYFLNSLDHYKYLNESRHSFGALCPAVADLPLDLEKLLPSFFQVQGMCSTNPKIFGSGLVEISLLASIVFLLIAFLMIFSQFFSNKIRYRRLNRYY